MSQGISRSKVRKDGSVHRWERYPVTKLWDGEYCHLCLSKSELNDCHHIVSRSESKSTIGYEQHWHNNLIKICIMCHEKINRKLSDSTLILKRLYYYVNAVHGLCTWKNRELLQKTCVEAVRVKQETIRKFPEYKWVWNYSFLDHVHMVDGNIKYIATAHYRASFCNKYIEKINNPETPFIFLEKNELSAFI